MRRFRAISSLLLALVLGSAPSAGGQVILTKPSGGDDIAIFPAPAAGLPNPDVVFVTGLPASNKRPHGVACFEDDLCAVGDVLNPRIFIVQVSTASVVGTLDTTGKYSGKGTVAVNRSRTFVLATSTSDSILSATNDTLAVIATPVTPLSIVGTVPMPGVLGFHASQAIVFDRLERAFVCHGNGISVLEPPYASIAFTIDLQVPPFPRCTTMAITPDGNQLLVPEETNGVFEGRVRIFTTPFSAASTFTRLRIPGIDSPPFQALQGIAVTPDGSKALLTSFAAPRLWAISAPFGSGSFVEEIVLPASPPIGFEDVAISPDGQLAILAGQANVQPQIPFILAPFTAGGATVQIVSVAGGRGAGAARFAKGTGFPPPSGPGPNCGPVSAAIALPPVVLGAAPAVAGVTAVPLATAILPTSRSVQVDCPATAFVTVINAGAEAATGVGITPAGFVSATFLYQTTDSATNALIGLPNTAVDIPAGQMQSYVIAITPTAAFPPTNIAFNFVGGNTLPVAAQTGLNTVLLSASLFPVPDVIALAGTVTNDGIVNVPGASGTGAFAVASVNVGAGASITVSADTGAAVAPVNLFVCQTDSSTGACLAPPAQSVTTSIDGGATPTFTILVQSTGIDVPFDPAGTRVFLRFKDALGITRGSTSVAVRTQ